MSGLWSWHRSKPRFVTAHKYLGQSVNSRKISYLFEHRNYHAEKERFFLLLPSSFSRYFSKISYFTVARHQVSTMEEWNDTPSTTTNPGFFFNFFRFSTRYQYKRSNAPIPFQLLEPTKGDSYFIYLHDKSFNLVLHNCGSLYAGECELVVAPRCIYYSPQVLYMSRNDRKQRRDFVFRGFWGKSG